MFKKDRLERLETDPMFEHSEPIVLVQHMHNDPRKGVSVSSFPKTETSMTLCKMQSKAS